MTLVHSLIYVRIDVFAHHSFKQDKLMKKNKSTLSMICFIGLSASTVYGASYGKASVEQGSMTIIRGGQSLRYASPQNEIDVNVNDVIRTAPESKVVIILTEDESQITAGGNSLLQAKPWKNPKASGVLRSLFGKLLAKTKEDRPEKKDLNILTTTVTVGVKGSEALVHTTGASTSVAALSGTIVGYNNTAINLESTQTEQDGNSGSGNTEDDQNGGDSQEGNNGSTSGGDEGGGTGTGSATSGGDEGGGTGTGSATSGGDEGGGTGTGSATSTESGSGTGTGASATTGTGTGTSTTTGTGTGTSTTTGTGTGTSTTTGTGSIPPSTGTGSSASSSVIPVGQTMTSVDNGSTNIQIITVAVDSQQLNTSDIKSEGPTLGVTNSEMSTIQEVKTNEATVVPQVTQTGTEFKPSVAPTAPKTDTKPTEAPVAPQTAQTPVVPPTSSIANEVANSAGQAVQNSGASAVEASSQVKAKIKVSIEK
ncbi:MAG: FecR domain-containing protein [SAR324 cluster bacterium]|nr:FecR domain-containing protein [SAR324 cluster bacterium]